MQKGRTPVFLSRYVDKDCDVYIGKDIDDQCKAKKYWYVQQHESNTGDMMIDQRIEIQNVTGCTSLSTWNI